jgi:hypothetical protein
MASEHKEAKLFPIGEMQLIEDIAHMSLDCLDTDNQRIGDFLVGLTLGYQK